MATITSRDNEIIVIFRDMPSDDQKTMATELTSLVKEVSAGTLDEQFSIAYPLPVVFHAERVISRVVRNRSRP